jgi:hypothetical protein
MNRKKLTTYLLFNLGRTLIISSVISLAIIYLLFNQEIYTDSGLEAYNHKNMINSFLCSFTISGLLALTSLTIFLNLKDNIRKNGTYSTLSFFLLPTVFVLACCVPLSLANYSYFTNIILIIIWSTVISFFILHLFSFLNFKRTIKKQSHA